MSLGMDAGVEGEAGEDRELVARVFALDVVGRVRLGVAELLCRFERVVEVGAVAAHRGEDVVGRAVDDRGDARDAVGEQVALERRDDRDAAADARLVEEVDAMLRAMARRLGPCLAMTSLFAVTTYLPCSRRARDVVERRLLAAHGLDNDVDVRVVDQAVGVCGQQGGVEGALPGSIPDEGAGSAQRGVPSWRA